MHVCTHTLFSRSKSVQDMSGSATVVGFIAISLSLWNWWAPPVQVLEFAPIPASSPEPPAAEFACSCSCPASTVQTIEVLAAQGGGSWSSVLIVVLLICWGVLLWVACRCRPSGQTVIYEAPRHHGAQALALDDDPNAVAGRRPIHVRGLRRGQGTMA